MNAWVFLLVFPLLFGAPVTARIESVTPEQCEKVRKLLVKQLDDHRSNVAVSACALGVATVVPPK